MQSDINQHGYQSPQMDDSQCGPKERITKREDYIYELYASAYNQHDSDDNQYMSHA